MSVLSTKQRALLHAKAFGLPAERKYPMPDKSHAAVAKSYAAQEEHKGKLSPAQKSTIDTKANRILGKYK